MDYMHERLRKARIDAGFRSAAAAARAHGWHEATYRHHENGTRGFDNDHSRSYARAFGVRATWLVGMDGPEATELKTIMFPDANRAASFALDDDAAINAKSAISQMLGITFLPHCDLSTAQHLEVSSRLSEGPDWVAFPTATLAKIAKVAPAHCFSIALSGSSMTPTAKDGAFLIVDGGHTNVDSHDDLWLLWQGSGPLVRRIRSSADGAFVLLADSSSVTPQVLPGESFEENSIDGVEVVGKVIWIGQAP